MGNLITLYYNEIKLGNITIDEVPIKLRVKVQEELDKEIVED